LDVLDLDMTLLIEKHVDVTTESTAKQVNSMKAWESSNRLRLMFIRMTIANNIKTSLPQTASALNY